MLGGDEEPARADAIRAMLGRLESVTFQEAIDLVKKNGKAGIYPELKSPPLYTGRGIDMLKIFAEASMGLVADRVLWELKIIGLLVIFGYAFFKFAWAYRLFNFTAILIGATPARADPDAAGRAAMVRRAARMNIAAGAHFTRGQRALFFALAYFGWFLGPWAFMATWR